MNPTSVHKWHFRGRLGAPKRDTKQNFIGDRFLKWKLNANREFKFNREFYSSMKEGAFLLVIGR